MRGKGLVAICLLLGTVSGFVGWSGVSSRPAGPHLLIASVAEMGVLDHDEYRSIPLKLRNDGTTTLELKPPITGCACTTGTLSQTALNPGQTAEVTIRYHAAQFPGAEIRQVIILPSNCREAPNREVVLHGRMRGALLAAPAAITVGAVRPGEMWTRSVRIRHSDADVRFVIHRASTGIAGWSTSVEQVASDECEIRISSVGNTLTGIQRGLVLVETDQGSTPLEIPVTVDVQSELRAVPSPLLFRRRSSDNTFDEETVVISGPAGFRVTPSGRKTLLLECVELPNEQPGSQLQKYLVRVSGSPAERARGVLEFRVEGVSHETTFSVPFLVIP